MDLLVTDVSSIKDISIDNVTLAPLSGEVYEFMVTFVKLSFCSWVTFQLSHKSCDTIVPVTVTGSSQ